MGTEHPSSAARLRAGLTLVEVMIVVAVIGALVSLAAPAMQRLLEAQRVKGAARSVADAFLLARGEAIRTGNPHIVFFSAGTPAATDPAGTSLGIDPRTNAEWPVVVLDDGPPAGSNCQIDPGEPLRPTASQQGVAWGYAVAPPLPRPPAPNDVGEIRGGDPADGTTFVNDNGERVTWVMFRGDGVPVTFDAGCNLSQIGSGGGAVYVTNGRRDYAVVLSPLGGVRVHAFEAKEALWTN
jgi:prepilin-type N-terminal cleavage/methylation domain-containing protein